MSNYKSILKHYPAWELEIEHPKFPAKLSELGPSYKKIYGIGNQDVLVHDSISIIGARRATPYGTACASMAGRVSAECGIVVVSGGAIGCDCAATRAALDAGGHTIIVPGCGADVLYPNSSDHIFIDTLKQDGCILSVEPWGSPPRKYTFTKRNAVIAALSQALIVCEAGKPSGTFSTATTAAELGKQVYAVPGSIFSPTSIGTNWLIETGASIVCDEDSLAGLVSLDYGRMRYESCVRVESKDILFNALIASPMSAAEIADLVQLDISSTFALLSEYEVAGMVCRLSDGRFMPTERVLLSCDV